SQTLSGHGTILLEGGNSPNSGGFYPSELLLPNDPNTTLTIGPGITIGGVSGHIGGGYGSLLLQGTVEADGGALFIDAASWSNTGTLAVHNGGVLYLQGNWSTNAPLTVSEPGVLILQGTWNAVPLSASGGGR